MSFNILLGEMLKGGVEILGDLPIILMRQTFVLAVTFPLTSLVSYSQATGDSSVTTFNALLANGQMSSLYAGFGLAVGHAVYGRVLLKSGKVFLKSVTLEGQNMYDVINEIIKRAQRSYSRDALTLFERNVYPYIFDGKLYANFCSWGVKSGSLRQSVSTLLEQKTTTTATKLDLAPNCLPEGWLRSLSMVSGGGMGFLANWYYNITDILLFTPVIHKLFGRTTALTPMGELRRLAYYTLIYPFQTLRTRCTLYFDELEAQKKFMALPILQQLQYNLIPLGYSTMAAMSWVSSSETSLDSSYLQGLYAGFFTFWCAGMLEFSANKLWSVLPFQGWYFDLRRKLLPGIYYW